LPHTPLDLTKVAERVILIGLITRTQDTEKVTEYLDELAFLAETAGAVTIKRFTQKLDHPDLKPLSGKGRWRKS
jgi:GTPase